MMYDIIVKPKSSPRSKSKSKSQIQVQNPKSKVHRKGTGTGADTIILQATTQLLSPEMSIQCMGKDHP